MTEPLDLAIVNGRVVTPSQVVVGGLAIRAGRICELLPPNASAHAHTIIDARGRYLIPGVVDSHVHFREPGLRHKECWDTGSRAAAVGGVTTVIDMPNTVPPFLDPAERSRRVDLVRGRSLVDFGFHLGVDEQSAISLGCGRDEVGSTLKVFMTGHHTAKQVIRDDRSFDLIFSRASELGVRVLLHAEDDETLQLLDGVVDSTHRSGDKTYEQGCPRTGCIIAIWRVIELVRRHGTATHILHVSSREEVQLLTAARAAGLPITFEVTAHHLTFTSSDVERVGPGLFLRPAIRDLRDRESLWDAVVNGDAATVGSDHAPHTRAEKALSRKAAPPGLPGVQEMLPALHTGLVGRVQDPDSRMSLIARLLSEAPSEIVGIGTRKGRLAVGYDADIVIFDPDVSWLFHDSDILSKCGWSAYSGRTFTGRVEVTIRRGSTIWDVSTGKFGTPDGAFQPGRRLPTSHQGFKSAESE